MKKFYLSLMALVGLTTTSMAQQSLADCPAVLARYYNVTAGSTSYCKLFIGGGPVATPADTPRVWLVAPAALGGQPIPDINGVIYNQLSNPGGGGTVEYNCETVDHIVIEYFKAGRLITCEYPVSAGGPLPIKLSSFTGKLNTETEATIAWTSSLEENSFKYDVQRSADGKNYVTVGTIKAAGTSVEAVKYSFNDPLPGNGGYYYRLSMVDIDGATEYSKVVYVNSKKGNGIVTKIFPNPFTSEIQLVGANSADLNTPGKVKVFNLSGQQIPFRIVGANAIAIDERAPVGTYFLTIQGDEDKKVYKLLKSSTR